jgi:glutathione S-transferase
MLLSEFPSADTSVSRLKPDRLDDLERVWLPEGKFICGRDAPSICDLLACCEITQLDLLSDKEIFAGLDPKRWPKISVWMGKMRQLAHFDEVHAMNVRVKASIEKQRASAPSAKL